MDVNCFDLGVRYPVRQHLAKISHRITGVIAVIRLIKIGLLSIGQCQVTGMHLWPGSTLIDAPAICFMTLMKASFVAGDRVLDHAIDDDTTATKHILAI